MRAGFCRVEITPDFSTAMAGFDRRTAPSVGVLDSLYVSVLALEDAYGELFLFCSYDLLGVERSLCDSIRGELADNLPVSPDRIWVCATHTHSAPSCVFSNSKHYDKNYIAQLHQKTVAAADYARQQLRPVQMAVGVSGVSGVSSRRNQGRAGADFAMPLLKLQFTSDQEPITICGFRCHPTILDEKNLLFSRDLPGAAAAQAENGERILFLNGACGDLSTRFTRTESSPGELRRIGGILAKGLNDTVVTPVETVTTIRFSRRQITLSRGAGPEGAQRTQLMDALRELMAQCKDSQMLREYDSRLAVLERQNVTAEPARIVEICAVDLGQLALVGLPFELDSGDCTVMERTLREVAGKPVYVQCYTGGYDGYLPSGAPLSINSSYEDIASRYMPESREQVLECAKQCVLETMS